MSVDAPVAQLQTESGPIYERSNLTRLQFLYWVAQVIRPDAPFLNTVVTFEILGQVDVSVFRQAFQLFLDQSDALRTVIVEANGVPQREVKPPFAFEFPLFDLSDEIDPRSTYDQWQQARMVRPFVLSERLFDTVLVKLADDRFIWYFNQHHIMADASAFELAFRSVAEIYEVLIAGGDTSGLPKRPLFQRYIDYERQFRDSVRYQKSERYWQKKLIPGPEPVRFYGQMPNKSGTAVTRLSVDLGVKLSNQLRQVAQQKELFSVNLDLTLYNIFTALFFIQLQQLTQTRRLGVVTPVHNRFTDEFREMVGLLMELCPLQVEISETDTFASVVKKMRRETRSTMPHYQYGSAIDLQNETFDCMFNMHEVPHFTLAKMPVVYTKVQVGHGSESLGCHVHNYTDTGNFVIHFDFHDEVFSAQHREETAASFQQLIRQFLDDPSHLINPIFAPTMAETGADAGSTQGAHSIDEAAKRMYVAPRNDMEAQMVRIWEEVLGVSQVGALDDFFALGGSSWLATRLFVRIQEVTGVNLPLSTLLEATTVERMTQVMRDSAAGRLWSPTVTLKPGDPTKRPFFLVPGAGGNLLRLDKLVGYLQLERPLIAFQVPGLDGQQKPKRSISEMAAYLIEIMREVQPQGPYILGGYSWGGMVAYDMACQLEAAGETTQFLAIIDTPAQNRFYRHVKSGMEKLGRWRGWNQQQQGRSFLAVRDKLFRIEYFFRAGYRDFNQMSWGEKRNVFMRKSKTGLRKLRQASKSGKPAPAANGAAPTQEASQDFWSRFNLDPLRLQIVRLNDRAIRLHIPQLYTGHAFVFQSSKGYRNPLNRSAAPMLGWGAVVKGGVEAFSIPGDHLGMLDEPNVQVLAEKLQTALDKTL